MNTVVKKLFWAFVLLIISNAMMAAMNNTSDDDKQARQVFEETYSSVFGPEGCTLTYDVNLIGLYKTSGTIWYKGKKNKFVDAKGTAWNDGETVYMVNPKKKTVNIYDAKSEKVNKYTGKFKFSFDDFNYSMKHNGDKLLLILKQKKSAKGTVKEAQIMLNAQTHTPIMARIKVMLFWANIKIGQFKAGNISDDIFVFPRANYSKGFKFIDNR